MWLNPVANTGNRLSMFDVKEWESLYVYYFSIIYKDSYDAAISSKNTGHFWSLHSPECPENNNVVIFHSHHTEPFHMHGRAYMLRQAVRGIKQYDKWQMNGRK